MYTAPMSGLALTNGEDEYFLAPSKIVCVGVNYRAHATEMGKPVPDEPVLFMKPPSALLASGQPIVRPRGYERVDFEGELAIVIRRRAHRVAIDKALDYVYGYTLVNDVTVRDLQKKDVQFTRAKGFDTFCPCGPRVRSTVATDWRDFVLTTKVNGVVKQRSPVTDLVFDVPTLISFISHVMTLEPGDVISTGTPPGVGPIVAGDVVEIEIPEIGVLSNPVVDGPALQ